MKNKPPFHLASNSPLPLERQTLLPFFVSFWKCFYKYVTDIAPPPPAILNLLLLALFF